MKMKRFLIFTKKELVESLKTYRALILGAALLLFAISSPLLAKYTPQIINALMSSEDMAAAGMNFVIPEPTFYDAFYQFFKNVTQIPLPVMIFITAAMVAGERSRGTCVIPFAHGLGRGTMIASKFTAVSIVWSVGYFVSVGVSVMYTALLFEGAVFGEYLLACFALWVYSEVIIAIALLCSALLRSSVMSTIAAFAAWFALMGTSFISLINKVSPSYLSDSVGNIITRVSGFGELLPALICSVIVIAAAIVTAQVMFRRQEL